MDLFRRLMEMSRSVDVGKSAAAPTMKVRPWEKIIAKDLPERLKRLYVAVSALVAEILPPSQCDAAHDRLERLALEGAKPEDHPDEVTFAQTHNLDHTAVNLLRRYLSYEIRREYVKVYLANDNLDLRIGPKGEWQVVTWLDADQSEAISEALQSTMSKLFG